jgi:hypothetical protein
VNFQTDASNEPIALRDLRMLRMECVDKFVLESFDWRGGNAQSYLGGYVPIWSGHRPGVSDSVEIAAVCKLRISGRSRHVAHGLVSAGNGAVIWCSEMIGPFRKMALSHDENIRRHDKI